MKTCLTLADRSPSRVGEKLSLYADRCDLIEIRLDFFDSPAVPPLPRHVRAKFIATCRPVSEGGRFKGDEQDRLALLRRCGQAGFDWIDLELDSELSAPLAPGCGLIRSHHEFQSFPNLSRAMNRLQQRGGDVLKMAVSVVSTAELTRLLSWMETLEGDQPRVVHGMGPLGQPSRFLGELLGNAWTYVSETDQAVAPGQFSLDTAEQLQKGAPRRILGVMGQPVAHSLSPGLHNWLLRRYGLDGWYLPFELDDLESWFRYLENTRLPFGGFSVTLPFKTAVIPFLESVDSPVNAVNTLTRRNSAWAGSNTDLEGFLEPLRRRLSVAGACASVLGNGGVAHTVVRALQREGAAVTVLGRDAERTGSFAKSYGCSWDLISDRPISADILVNTTPVGQWPEVDQCLLEPGQLQCRLVYDLIYNPPRTELIRRAEREGCQTISGVEMFVEQAAQQFETWTGIHPDRSAMANWLTS